MAWYRIAENVLDAIADAINAKTGKTAPMTPVDMVSEIQSIQTGGGGTVIQSGHFTPADAASTYSVVVDEEIASNKFVVIFSIDSETTPTNLGVVEALYFVPDPSVAVLKAATQIVIMSSATVFNANVVRSTTSGSWYPSTRTLVMSARGGSNFYAGSRYSYVIIPLSALVSVYR